MAFGLRVKWPIYFMDEKTKISLEAEPGTGLWVLCFIKKYYMNVLLTDKCVSLLLIYISKRTISKKDHGASSKTEEIMKVLWRGHF